MSELNDSETDKQETRKKPKSRYRWLKIAAIVVVVVLILIWVGQWLNHRLTHVSSKDAQIATHEVTVSSRLAGRVTHFPLIIGDHLDKNEGVAALYSKPDRIKLARFKAKVDSVQHKLAAQKAHLHLAETRLSGGIKQTRDVLHMDIAAKNAARASMIQAHKNAKRAERLYKAHSVSRQERDNTRYQYRAAKARYEEAKQKVKRDHRAMKNAKNGMLLSPPSVLPNPDVLRKQVKVTQSKLAEAKAHLKHQRTRVQDLRVRSPIVGVVDKTFISKGDYVSAGQPILMMHNPQRVWVMANIKETKVGDLRVGQPVSMEVDAHPDIDYSGHILVIGHAATNQFSLLPNPNPSGTFTKVTQRIPVRIAIDHGPRRKLSPGMMVEVDIDKTARPDKQEQNKNRGE